MGLFRKFFPILFPICDGCKNWHFLSMGTRNTWLGYFSEDNTSCCQNCEISFTLCYDCNKILGHNVTLQGIIMNDHLEKEHKSLDIV